MGTVKFNNQGNQGLETTKDDGSNAIEDKHGDANSSNYMIQANGMVLDTNVLEAGHDANDYDNAIIAHLGLEDNQAKEDSLGFTAYQSDLEVECGLYSTIAHLVPNLENQTGECGWFYSSIAHWGQSMENQTGECGRYYSTIGYQVTNLETDDRT